ncbi:MAG: transcriptional repressor [candidate division KSB1 bacterium]|nr:transcriptional repressor [candidate division KSB1 bacterium]
MSLPDEVLRPPGRRLTRQRRIIYEIVRSRRDHPSAAEIHKEALRHLPSISLGTVYRNLKLLAEQGLIREITYLGEGSRFDGYPELHAHVVCRRCGKVLDLELDVEAKLDSLVASKTGFRNLVHSLTFYGVCPECFSEAKHVTNQEV